MFPPPTFNNDMMQQQQQMNDQMQRQQHDLNNQMSQQQQNLERSMREMEEQNRELMRQQQEEMLRNMSFQEQMNEFARQMQENTIKATFTIGATSIIFTLPDPKEEIIDLGKDILWDLFWEFVTEGILGIIFDGDGEILVNSDPPRINKPEGTSEEEPIECDCFIAGTLVTTDKGPKPIEEIQVGDKVLAKDDKTGDIQFKNVNHLFKKETEITYTVKVGKEKIITTPDHPFWIKDRGWVEAEYLRTNDLLTTSSGQWLPIKDIVIEQQKIIVYNFEVDEYHSYFVSNLDIWVHNDCSRYVNPALYYKAKGMFEELSQSGSASNRLNEGLEIATGLERPKGLNNSAKEGEIRVWAAHHIVPHKGGNTEEHKYGEMARKILVDNGIHINSPANGVWLPSIKGGGTLFHQEDDWGNEVSAHNGYHQEYYFDQVLKELQKAQTVIDELTVINPNFPDEEKSKIVGEYLHNIRTKLLTAKLSVHSKEE